MAFKGKRRGARRGRKFPAKKRSKKSATVKLIKQVMASEVETKFAQQNVGNGSFNSLITTADIIYCLPQIAQDTGAGNPYERVGVRLTPRSLTLKCHASITPNLNRSTAITVHYFVLTAREAKYLPLIPTSVGVTRLLRTGNPTNFSGFTGDIPTSQLPVNNSTYVVLQRGSFNLSKNTGDIQDSTTAGNQPLMGPVCKDWEIKLKTPAKLIYDPDNAAPRTQLYPQNFAPFMVFGYTHQDGSTPDFANQDLSVYVSSQLWYDDA